MQADVSTDPPDPLQARGWHIDATCGSESQGLSPAVPSVAARHPSKACTKVQEYAFESSLSSSHPSSEVDSGNVLSR